MNENPVIRWRGYVRVKSEKKARERFSTIQKHLGGVAVLKSCEPYWKIKELYEICFSTPQEGETPEAIVFNAMLRAGTLGRKWYFKVPVVYWNGTVEFEGLLVIKERSTSSDCSIPNLESLHFRITIGVTPSEVAAENL